MEKYLSRHNPKIPEDNRIYHFTLEHHLSHIVAFQLTRALKILLVSRKMFDTKNMENDDEDSEIITKMQKRILEDDGDTVKPKKKKIRKENDLYKQPTVEELNQLRETENLYHSNLFRLQIEEILNEVKLKEKYKKQFKQWFSLFKQKIESIEETEEKQVINFLHSPII